MDRQIIYVGAQPLAEDILRIQVNTMAAIGGLARAVLGTGTVVEGLTVNATQPTSLAVQVQSGAIYVLASIDATPYGVLPADTNHQTVKQGLIADAVTLPIAPPPTVGQSRNYLVQAAYRQIDDNATVIPYFNSSNPAQSWAGPANTGAAQNTRRVSDVVISTKAGAAATTGTQSTPTPDAGYVGLAVVVVANGAVQITSANITVYAGVPRLLHTLPELRPGFFSTVAYTTPGSYSFVVPTGVSSIKVMLKGGGGGGAGSKLAGPGNGGAGGGYAEGLISVSPGNIIPVIVGARGVAGTGGLAGGSGGTTSFGAFMSATGGQGGNTTPGVANSGGLGVGGSNTNAQGTVGGYGWQLGAGGSHAGGMGGASWDTSVTMFAVAGTGHNGIGPGGGAGGGGTNATGPTYFAGGLGGPGIVSIDY